MPNYCENDLYVYGCDEDVSAFLEYAKGNDEGEPTILDFGRFVPEPEGELAFPKSPKPSEVAETPAEWVERCRTSPNDWHEWRIGNWGTKCNADEPRLDDDCCDPDRVKMTFATAWNPPKPVVLAMSKRFPTLRFSLEYYEAGCGFHGRYSCEGGEEEEDLCGEYFGARGG